MMYFVYILYNKNSKKFYIGFTKDIDRRLSEHHRSKLTHRNKNYELIFLEEFVNQEDAQRREGYFKTTKGRKSLKLVLRETLKSNIIASS